MSIKNIIFPICLGFFVVLVLFTLGQWQLSRLQWKNDLLDNIERKLLEQPVNVPVLPTEGLDKYRSVRFSGSLLKEEIHVLTSIKLLGPGFLAVSPFLLDDGRKILVDRGFIPENEKNLSRYWGLIELEGNLFWPNETDGFTPEANLSKNIWFARDIELMSVMLKTEPIMVVITKSSLDHGAKMQSLDVNLPNNHLQYAITWFSLATIWFFMSIYLIIVTKRKNNLS